MKSPYPPGTPRPQNIIGWSFGGESRPPAQTEPTRVVVRRLARRPMERWEPIALADPVVSTQRRHRPVSLRWSLRRSRTQDLCTPRTTPHSPAVRTTPTECVRGVPGCPAASRTVGFLDCGEHDDTTETLVAECEDIEQTWPRTGTQCIVDQGSLQVEREDFDAHSVESLQLIHEQSESVFQRQCLTDLKVLFFRQSYDWTHFNFPVSSSRESHTAHLCVHPNYHPRTLDAEQEYPPIPPSQTVAPPTLQSS